MSERVQGAMPVGCRQAPLPHAACAKNRKNGQETCERTTLLRTAIISLSLCTLLCYLTWCAVPNTLVPYTCASPVQPAVSGRST